MPRVSICTLVTILALVAGSAAQTAPPAAPATTQSGAPATVPAGAELCVGDAAPPLKVAEWIKGQPVQAYERGKVYVVEFWASWCGPCISAMPHLTELQKRYRDKGLVVIGLTSEDRRNTLQAVEKLVEEKGDALGYAIAWDQGRATSDAYMRAAGQNAIPCSFVVDKSGRIAWIGSPSALDKVLAQIVDDKFDLAAQTRAFKEQRAIEKALRAAQPQLEQFGPLMRDGKHEEVLTGLDTLAAQHPVLASRLAMTRFQVLLTSTKQYDAAYKFLREAVEKYYGKEPTALCNAAWLIMDHPAVEQRDLGLALELAKKAAELQKNDASTTYVLALAHFKNNEAAQAVALQKIAIELAQAEGADEGALKELNARLAEFEAVANKK